MKKTRLLVAALALAGVGVHQPAFSAPADPDAPLLGSFIEDFAYARDRIDAEIGGVGIACDHEPCTLRLDLDDDGERDLVVQVDDGAGQPGLAVLITNGPALLAGATAGPAVLESALLDLLNGSAASPWRGVTAAQLVKTPSGVKAGVLISDVLVVVDGGALDVHTGIAAGNNP